MLYMHSRLCVSPSPFDWQWHLIVFLFFFLFFAGPLIAAASSGISGSVISGFAPSFLVLSHGSQCGCTCCAWGPFLYESSRYELRPLRWASGVWRDWGVLWESGRNTVSCTQTGWFYSVLNLAASFSSSWDANVEKQCSGAPV